jgi:hypothetical protein
MNNNNIPSASYIMCKKMITDVFKNNKENMPGIPGIPGIPKNVPEYYKIVNISGSGCAAAKFLR